MRGPKSQEPPTPIFLLLDTCEGTGCGMVFINGSRGKRRRWCSMAECGNLSKVHAYRQRQKGIS
ncbi:MAG: CGNR zinc finger domain-containing protein [Ktedonobacteraceae bacterium]